MHTCATHQLPPSVCARPAHQRGSPQPAPLATGPWAAAPRARSALSVGTRAAATPQCRSPPARRAQRHSSHCKTAPTRRTTANVCVGGGNTCGSRLYDASYASRRQRATAHSSACRHRNACPLTCDHMAAARATQHEFDQATPLPASLPAASLRSRVWRLHKCRGQENGSLRHLPCWVLVTRWRLY